MIGAADFGDDDPLPRDAIFRIASLTKPIAAAAAMVLVDDGVLAVDAPVDGLLPELAEPRVLRSLDADLDDTVPADRPITLEDLLTFRLGSGVVMAPPNTYPVQAAEAALELRTWGPPWPPTPHTPDEWMARFATLPLLHQPGERWMYNTGAQVLGVLLERAAGVPLERFLQDRIFEPLGMVDTGFSVPPDQAHRLTTAYAPDPDTGELDRFDGNRNGYWNRPPALPNAAGWLVSTVDDYWSFVLMVLGRGEHDGRRIVSEASIDLMTTDHLTPAQRDDATLFLGEASGWGFGMAVPAGARAGHSADQSRGEAVPGGFGWDGGSGVTWRSDLDRDLTGILLTQRQMTSPQPPEAFVDFWDGAYGARTG